MVVLTEEVVPLLIELDDLRLELTRFLKREVMKSKGSQGCASDVGERLRRMR